MVSRKPLQDESRQVLVLRHIGEPGDIAGTVLAGAEQPPDDLAIRVVDESAAEVPLAGSSTTAEYDIGGRAGTSITCMMNGGKSHSSRTRLRGNHTK